jgi:hypothetical protein
MTRFRISHIACLLQPMGCARLNDMCVHDGTMGQMLPSTDSAIRRSDDRILVLRSAICTVGRLAAGTSLDWRVSR